MNALELINFIRNHDIAIYGTGFVAETFYTILQTWNLGARVKYFIVTDAENAHGTTLQGVSVRALEDTLSDKGIFICIAVHEAIKDEIEMALTERNRNNFVWIHPYIVELALGTLVEHHKRIPVSRLIGIEPYGNYALAVRYLAIENYFGKNDIGYGVYVKTFSKHCEIETARKRLKRFINLIADWDENGYQQEKDILIDVKNRRIDGTHRLSLACYYGMEYIYCDVYPYSDNYDKIMKGGAYVGIELLKSCNLNSTELNALQQANMKLREKWN